METNDIIADRFTLTQPGNGADVYNALLDDTDAAVRHRVVDEQRGQRPGGQGNRRGLEPD